MDTRPVGSPTTAPTNATPTATTPAASDSGKAAASRRVKGSRDDANAPRAGVVDGRKDWDVQISPEAIELADARRKAMAIAKETEPVREDRVSALKKKIADGNYKIDAAKIADGMLNEAIKDHVAANPEEYWERD